MRYFGIRVNTKKDANMRCTEHLVGFLKKRGITPVIEEHTKSVRTFRDVEYTTIQGIAQTCELLIVFGGDGTLLKAARDVAEFGLPLLGINMGRLGFMSEIELEDFESLDKLIAGDYRIEERMMLKGRIHTSEETVELSALNDIVISRGCLSRMIDLDVYVEDTFVNSYPADGIVISTPTGSTAYSLSAGGPVTEPDMHLIVMTPICPHTLHARSVIVSDERKIKVMLRHSEDEMAFVSVDGQDVLTMNSTDMVEIERSAQTVRLIKIRERGFYQILREKLSSSMR